MQKRNKRICIFILFCYDNCDTSIIELKRQLREIEKPEETISLYMCVHADERDFPNIMYK